MNPVEANAIRILRILAATDIPIQNPIVHQRALQLGIDGEDFERALEFAGAQDWIENAAPGSIALTNAGRARAGAA